jgi:DNA-binding IclR family transcriptional regulator
VDDSGQASDLTTLRRGLQVLDLLRSANPGASQWSNQQIADTLKLDKSVVSRTLRVLLELGFVERSADGRTFAPGPRTYPIGARSVDQDVLRAAATVVREIVRLTESRAYLSVRHSMDAVTLWSDQPVRARPRVHSIGTTFPLGVSEAGRSLLFGSSGDEIAEVAAEMRRIGVGHADQLARQIELDRRAGFAWRRADESGVAVPVWNTRNDVVIGALGVASENLSNRDIAEATASLLISAASNLARRIQAMQANSATVAPLPYSGWPEMPTDMFPLSRHVAEGPFPEFLGD